MKVSLTTARDQAPTLAPQCAAPEGRCSGRGAHRALTPLPLCPGSSKIRIRDGRAKPIDLLAKYISAEDDDLAVEMHEPYTFLNGLTVADMEDLLEDIQVTAARPPHSLSAPANVPCPHLAYVRPAQVYMELEQGKNVDFWRDMTIITEDEIAKLRKLEASGKGPGNLSHAYCDLRVWWEMHSLAKPPFKGKLLGSAVGTPGGISRPGFV